MSVDGRIQKLIRGVLLHLPNELMLRRCTRAITPWQAHTLGYAQSRQLPGTILEGQLPTVGAFKKGIWYCSVQELTQRYFPISLATKRAYGTSVYHGDKSLASLYPEHCAEPHAS